MTVLVFATTVVALGAPAASAACPNEAFRTGPSALLPECRAYEQVTPVDKESAEGVADTTNAYVSPLGDGIFFSTVGAFAGAQQSVQYTPYVAERSATAWDTRGVGATIASGGILFGASPAVSPDLGLSFLASDEALAPGGIAEGSNLYVRDNRTGAFTTVLALPGRSYFQSWGSNNGGGTFLAATSDWSNILVTTPEGVAEFREGALHLAAANATGAGRSEATPNVLAADGRSFFYTDGPNILHEYRRGQEPLLVSEDGNGNPISIIGEGFVGASPDGDVAYYRTSSSGLYRFQASAPAGSRTTAVAPPTGLEGEPTQASQGFSSPDASTVYFNADDRLTADAPAGGGLYVWRAGALRFIAGLGGEQPPGSVSSDGDFFGFQSRAAATPEASADCAGFPSGKCQNVFLYSYATDRLACVSCSGSPVGDSRLGGTALKSPIAQLVHPVLDDGTILFDSPDRLVAQDSNGVLDPYSWREGRAQLISTGTAASASSFVGASADGSDVYFQTAQPLVGQDRDAIPDLYDARVDGGLPQGGAEEETSCVVGGDCREGVVTSSAPGLLATAAGGGGREAGDACGAARAKARAAKQRSRALNRRARRADGRAAKALRKSAARTGKAARRLNRAARNCTGGAR